MSTRAWSTRRMVPRLFAEGRGSTNRPLFARLMFESADETIDFGGADWRFLVPFGLNVDPVETQRVLIDHTVHPPSPVPPKSFRHLLLALTIVHFEQSVMIKSYDARVHLAHLIEELGFQLGVELAPGAAIRSSGAAYQLATRSLVHARPERLLHPCLKATNAG